VGVYPLKKTPEFSMPLATESLAKEGNLKRGPRPLSPSRVSLGRGWGRRFRRARVSEKLGRG